MKHLITGGSGFLGSLIAKRLVERGESVDVLDLWEDSQRPPEIRYIKGDVTDRDCMAAALQGIDVVHHNAALVPLSKSGARYQEVDYLGSKIVAEEAVKARVQAFIHMSSTSIFGLPDRCPITAATPARPIEIYGRAKLAGEEVVREICLKNNLPLWVVRPRTIVGAGRLGIFQILFEWIKEGRNVYVIGSGNHPFQFVHAHDLMDAYMLAFEKNLPGNYNVGTDRFGTLRESLEHLIQYAGSRSKVLSLPESLTINGLRVLDWLNLSPLAPWHYLTYHRPYYFDVQPLLDIGWQPKYSNDELMRESYQWFLDNEERLKVEKAQSPHRAPVKEGIISLLKRLS